jgi:hypothetical protein
VTAGQFIWAGVKLTMTNILTVSFNFALSLLKLHSNFIMGAGASITEVDAILLMQDDYIKLKGQNLNENDMRKKLTKIYQQKFLNSKTDDNDVLNDYDDGDDDDDKVLLVEKANRLNRSKHTIMISLQVRSMHKSALILKEILENQGYKVWICTEMTGGRVI